MSDKNGTNATNSSGSKIIPKTSLSKKNAMFITTKMNVQQS